MALQQVADAHYVAQQQIVRATAEQAQSLWGELAAASVIKQWMDLLAQIVDLLTGGQLRAARLAMPYLRLVAKEQGASGPLRAQVDPFGFAGRGADGRDLATLLMQPALRTAGLVARGADDQEALRSGLASLTRIIATEIPDAGRAAVGAGITANRRFTTYIRMMRLPSCSRCIVLAGKTYPWSEGFARHDRCDCYHLAVVHDGTGDLPGETPQQVFRGLTREQQDAAFGMAAAEAIRAGADIGRVVNARRGVYVAGEREFTRTGIRGRKRSPREARPTSEQIIRDNADDRAAAIEQLRRHGYIL
ncbi:hypothetical protein ACIBHX_01995 [Nonomuraea sp. NPDC050536]|uniref:VG15 protein n=1 Tax=Nonomuraea sp. NPDC050536 TaxID=3364366 RepID=UPI0037C69CB1